MGHRRGSSFGHGHRRGSSVVRTAGRLVHAATHFSRGRNVKRTSSGSRKKARSSSRRAMSISTPRSALKKVAVDDVPMVDEHEASLKRFHLKVHKRPKGLVLLDKQSIQCSQIGFMSAAGGNVNGPAVTPGQQGISEFAYLGTSGMITSSTTGYGISNGPIAWKDLNVNQFTTGGNYWAAGKEPAGDRFLWKSSSIDLQVKSGESCSQYVTIYVVLAKKDTTNLAQTQWQAGLASEGAIKTGAMSAAEMTFVANMVPGATSGVAGYASQSMVGQSPASSRLFKQYFKFLHTYKFILEGGQEKRIIYDLDVEKLVKHELITNDGSLFIQGHTIAFIMVSHAGVILDNNLNTFTYAAPDLSWVYQSRTTVYSVKGKKGASYIQSGATNIPYDTTAAHQKELNVTDTVAAVAIVS